MGSTVISIFHNEKNLYDKYINGLYGDSGFKLADKGYILNRNNDSENTRYLKENTPSNFSILDRNYDTFRFDVARNDIYLYAISRDSKFLFKNKNYIMPSIDHFTTSKKWKTFVDKVFSKTKNNEGGLIYTDDIKNYNIKDTTEINDPIKFFKKKNFDYFVNFPISEDFISTKTHTFIYNTTYNFCDNFIHVHYIHNNPNQEGQLFRLGLYCLTIYEIEEHLYEFDIKSLLVLVNTVLVNICSYFVCELSINIVNAIKKCFLLLLKVKKRIDEISSNLSESKEEVYNTLDSLFYLIFLKLILIKDMNHSVDFTLLKKVISTLKNKEKQMFNILLKNNIYDLFIKDN